MELPPNGDAARNQEDLLPTPQQTVPPPPELPTQGIGPHFCFDDTGKLDVAPPEELDRSGNHLTRLKAFHPTLRQLSISISDRLQTPNQAHGFLADRARDYRDHVDTELNEINFSLLYIAGLRLENALHATERAIHRPTDPLPDLEPEDHEQILSLLRIHGPFIMASAEGAEAVQEANLYRRDQEDERAFLKHAAQFRDNLNKDPLVATAAAIDAIDAALDVAEIDVFPERGKTVGYATIISAAIVITGGATIAAAPVVGSAIWPMMGGYVGSWFGVYGAMRLQESESYQKTKESRACQESCVRGLVSLDPSIRR